ncbi:MAG: TRAP transporter permease, partial [Candidatus Lokiarchaeota archaeon]|nr:TRAP transporter permease [Candidatus Lokiarchaeota archaeon]
MEPILLVFIIFAISLIIGLPIYISMLLSSTMYFIFLGDIPFFVLAQKVFSSVDSFLLLAVPLFILAAKLMEHSGILNSLADLCRALVGHITGGLAHVT